MSSVVLGETQRSHADDPLWAAKRPATHSRQGSPASEKLPGSHAVHNAPSAAGSVPGSHGPHSTRSSPTDISPRGPVVNWRGGRVMVVVVTVTVGGVVGWWAASVASSHFHYFEPLTPTYKFRSQTNRRDHSQCLRPHPLLVRKCRSDTASSLLLRPARIRALARIRSTHSLQIRLCMSLGGLCDAKWWRW